MYNYLQAALSEFCKTQKDIYCREICGLGWVPREARKKLNQKQKYLGVGHKSLF